VKTELDPVRILGLRRALTCRARLWAHSVPWRQLGTAAAAGVGLGLVIAFAFWLATS
jgi:ElaB/YqjD/DUF883 family membrane-anchored ribosome-binding protein